MNRPTAWRTAAALALSLALAGCGGDEADDNGSGGAPGGGAEPPADPTALWVTAADAEEVHRIDLDGAEVTDTVGVEGYPLDVDVAFGSVWVATYPNGVSRIDPESGEVEAIEVDNITDLAVGDDTVWVGQSDPVGVVPLDPESGELGDPIELPEDADPEEMEWADGVLYASSGYDSTVHRLDTDSGETDSVEMEGPVTDLALAGDALYVADFYATVEVDPESLEVVAEHEYEDGRPWALAADPDGDRLWVASQGGVLGTLDLESGEYGADVVELSEDALTDSPESMVRVDDSLWLVMSGGAVLRIDPSTMEVSDTVTLPSPPGEAHVAVE